MGELIEYFQRLQEEDFASGNHSLRLSKISKGFDMSFQDI